MSKLFLLFSLILLSNFAFAQSVLKPCDPKLPFDNKATPVHSPHVGKIPYKCLQENGRHIKVFHITAEKVMRDFLSNPLKPNAKSMEPGPIYTWGYNGSTSGPTIEAIEGEWVRFIVKNKLPDATAIHWHGLVLPNAQDGGGTHTQKLIEPGKTHIYEFQLNQHGTHMYHSGHDIAKQHAMGLGGFFIIHPQKTTTPVDHDITFFLNMWTVNPHSQIPDTMSMMFNFFTMNGKSGPAISSIDVKSGEKVRVRFANLSMMEHPIHLHGHHFKVVAKGAKRVSSVKMSQDTVGVKTGQPIEIEFNASKYAGTWLFHCHLPHHVTNNMEIDPVPGETMVHEDAGMFTSIQIDRDKKKKTVKKGKEYDPHAKHRAGAPIAGRYIGQIEFDSGKKFLTQLDLYKVQKEHHWRKFQATLKYFLGGFGSPEYFTEHYHDMDYSFESNVINIENTNKSLVLQEVEVHKSDKEVSLEGLACSGFSGECGNFYLKLVDKDLSPVEPLEVKDAVRAVSGEYSGKCDGIDATLQIESHRGATEDDLTDVHPMGAYLLTGRIGKADKLAMPGTKMVTSSFDNGEYDYFNGELVMSGQLGTLTCKVDQDKVSCPEDKCRFRRNTKLDGLSLPNSGISKTGIKIGKKRINEFSRARNVEGDFYGYIYHQHLDKYQKIKLSVGYKKYSTRPMQLERPYISAIATTYFGTSSKEKMSFRFAKRMLLDSSSLEDTKGMNTLALEDGRDNTFIIQQWTHQGIKGVWYSNTFGRVGEVELVRGHRFPKLKTNLQLLPAIAGTYTHRVGNLTRKVKIQSLSSRMSDEGQNNPYFPRRLRGRKTLLISGKTASASEITQGTYDYFTGHVSFAFHPLNTDEVWMGGTIGDTHLELFDPGNSRFMVNLLKRIHKIYTLK